ncbi:MAG: hypothetical protein ACC662_08170, partial [Planctomycetota bacterium]
MEVRIASARCPVEGVVQVPPSKSIHQRVLVLDALAGGGTRIETGGAEPGDDVKRLGEALRQVGPWCGAALGPGRERLHLDLGLGATGLRFTLALATLRPEGARTLVRGRPALLRRPHTPLRRALVRLGAHIKRRHSGALRVLGGGLRGGADVLVTIPATSSSQ